MTAEADSKEVIIVDNIEETFEAKAKRTLNIPEYNMMLAYIQSGRHPLAPDTVTALFQLYLNGSDCAEVHRLNKGLPYEAILWARVKFDWDAHRDKLIVERQEKIRDKVLNSQLQTTELMADLLAATAKKHGDKIKKYIQTGDEADLGGSLSIDNLHQLLKIAEGLQKITGQDKVQKIETKNTQRFELGVGGKTVAAGEEISDEGATAVLAILAEEKRKRRLAEEESKKRGNT